MFGDFVFFDVIAIALAIKNVLVRLQLACSFSLILSPSLIGIQSRFR